MVKRAYKNIGFTEHSQLRLYVKITDAVNNNSSVILGDVTIVEPATGTTLLCSNTEELVANNGFVIKDVDFEVTPFVGYNKNQEITLVFNNNILANTVANNLYLSKNDEVIYPEYDVVDNKIIIYPPEYDDGTNGYVYDVIYELHIDVGIKSIGGNNMQTKKTVFLYFMDKYVNSLNYQ